MAVFFIQLLKNIQIFTNKYTKQAIFD